MNITVKKLNGYNLKIITSFDKMFCNFCYGYFEIVTYLGGLSVWPGRGGGDMGGLKSKKIMLTDHLVWKTVIYRNIKE